MLLPQPSVTWLYIVYIHALPPHTSFEHPDLNDEHDFSSQIYTIEDTTSSKQHSMPRWRSVAKPQS